MARHIQALHVDTFRGIRQLKIDDLGDVNILVGDNNSGKTSVLEAIQLLCDPNKYNLNRIAKQRENFKTSLKMGLSALESLLYMFDVKYYHKEENNYYLNIGGTIKNQTGSVSITGSIIDQLIDTKELSNYTPLITNKNTLIEAQQEVPTFVGTIRNEFLEFKWKQVSLFDVKSINEPASEGESFEVNKYTRVVRDKNEQPFINVEHVLSIDHVIDNVFDKLITNKSVKNSAVELLKEFDDSITDIRYISDDNKFVPVIENQYKDYIPLSLYGDGMKKALTLMKAVINAKNGVVVVDEFETALHTSAMKRVFKFIIGISKKYNVQLFLTTHSIEAVDKLLESAGSEVDNIKVIRLRKKEGLTFSKVIDGKEALEDRKEYNMELRV